MVWDTVPQSVELTDTLSRGKGQQEKFSVPENALRTFAKAHSEPQSDSEGPEIRPKQEDATRQNRPMSRDYEEAS